MENVRVCLTSVEQRLRDMDKMGVDVQAISVSPFQFMYGLPAEHGRKTARMTNENLAEIVQKHPDRFVALANVPPAIEEILRVVTLHHPITIRKGWDRG